MKKLFALVLALTMVFALTACVDLEGLVSDLDSDLSSAFPDETSGSDIPDISPSTDAGAGTEPEDSGDGNLSVTSFLAPYGMTEADITPENFRSFESVGTEGKAGEAGYSGFIKINVDKDATDMEDINAWFDKIYAKIQSRSDDGKIYKNYLFDTEATSIEELKAGALWSVLPGFGPYFYKDTLSYGKSIVVFTARYDTEKGQYSVGITLWGPAA